MQLGTNDLTAISAVETGSAIEDLCRLLYESYGVELICEHMTKMVSVFRHLRSAIQCLRGPRDRRRQLNFVDSDLQSESIKAFPN